MRELERERLDGDGDGADDRPEQFDASAFTTLKRIRGTFELEDHNRWSIEWRRDCAELEIMNAEGTRSKTIAATDREVLRFAEMVVSCMIEVNLPPRGTFGVVRTRGI